MDDHVLPEECLTGFFYDPGIPLTQFDQAHPAISGISFPQNRIVTDMGKIDPSLYAEFKNGLVRGPVVLFSVNDHRCHRFNA